MEESNIMLTTFQNPFDPFENFMQWRLFDIEQMNALGFQPTCEYLARIAKLRDDMTEKEVEEEIERAIDEILLYNPLNIYKKVFRNSKETN